MTYGEPPVSLGPVRLGSTPAEAEIKDVPAWTEFMHYLYLPVRLPRGDVSVPLNAIDAACDDITLPPRLEFLREPCYRALDDAIATSPHFANDPYVYVTARRGFASPGNPLNRPGWHCDDFGGTDLNYIWCDVFPTRYLISTTGSDLVVRPDDRQSILDMASLAEMAGHAWTDIVIRDVPLGELVRLTPHVIHDTPIIPAPGGMRSFFKISVSTERYDLVGNSHNYELEYDWPMVDRSVLRNQPVGGDRDYSRIAVEATEGATTGADR